MNHLMCLQYWNPAITPDEIIFDWNPFWIQVHNLLMEFLNSANGATILQKVGKVVEIEESILEGRVLRTYLRARVLLDVNKPFPTGCWIPKRNLPKVWVIYKYERLQDLCFNCRCLGHEQRFCKIPRIMSTYCSSIPKYDQSIIAQPAKTIKAILKEHKQRYGDSTKNTTHKFQRENEAEESSGSTKKGTDSQEEESEEVIRERVRRAWAEIIANCSSGTDIVPTTYRPSGL